MDTCENCKFWKHWKHEPNHEWGTCTYTLPPQLKDKPSRSSGCHKLDTCSLFNLNENTEYCVIKECTNIAEDGWTVCSDHSNTK